MDSSSLAQQLTQYDNNRVNSTDALNSALAQYGVPEIRNSVGGLRTTVANTTNALNNVDPSVTGRTQGSLVTEAQRQRQVSNERAPIATQLGTQTSALGTQEKALSEAQAQAQTLATNKVNDYNLGRTALQDRYNNAYTREQNAAQQAAAQQAAARAQANEDRNYALAAQKTNYTTSGAAAAQKPLSQTQATAAIRQGLESVKGSDNHVAPQDLAKAHNDWLSSGLSDAAFWKNFQGYWNDKQGNYRDQFNAAR